MMIKYEASAELENLDQKLVKPQAEIEKKLQNIIETKHQQMKVAIIRNKEVADKFYLRLEN